MGAMRAIAQAFYTEAARTLIAVLLVGGTLALLLANRPVPEVMFALDGVAVGFYFGGKTSVSQSPMK